MSVDGRLNRVAPMLTARERAILILESWKEDRKEDPSWRYSMPANQALEFNHLIELMNGANLSLGPYLALVHEQIAKIELRQAWLVALVLWEEQVQEIEAAVRVALKGVKTDKLVRERLNSAIRQQRLKLKGESPDVGVRDRLAAALIETLAGCFSDIWQEVSACELVLAEVAAHFNGTDPLRPRYRGIMTDCGSKLADLERELGYLGVTIEKPEPDQELVALVRRIVRLG
jgi:hypothetical protein